MTVMSDGLWRSAQAEIEAEAGSLAASLLAEVGSEARLQTGARTGQYDNGLSWQLRTEPYADPGTGQGPIAAYRVTAEVSWHDGRKQNSVALSTLRLGPTEPAR